MRKTWILAVVLLVVVFGGIFGGKWLQDRHAATLAAGMRQPAAAVETVVAASASWDESADVVGTLVAVEGAEVTAQIAGNITAVLFRPGTRVAKGAVLVQLDDSSERAQLQADEAQLAVAKSAVERARQLFAANAASEAALQDAEARYGTALAAVAGDRALLAKLRITAPFAGVVGVREVSTGQYVSPGTPIVRLENPDPLLLNFALPQQFLARLKPGGDVRLAVDSYPGETFHGRITALDSGIDPETRNINIQAAVRNADGRLRPGLYGSVSLGVGTALAGVALPETAIAYSTFGNIVYVVEPDANGGDAAAGGIARARTVRILAHRPGAVLVAGNVKAGDTVVVAGQNKLQDGAAVAVHNGAATDAAAPDAAGGQ